MITIGHKKCVLLLENSKAVQLKVSGPFVGVPSGSSC